MNKNRIHKALGHIEDLIEKAERKSIRDAGIQEARDGFAYIEYILGSIADDAVKPIFELREASARITRWIDELEETINDEPKRPGLTLGN